MSVEVALVLCVEVDGLLVALWEAVFEVEFAYAAQMCAAGCYSPLNTAVLGSEAPNAEPRLLQKMIVQAVRRVHSSAHIQVAAAPPVDVRLAELLVEFVFAVVVAIPPAPPLQVNPPPNASSNTSDPQTATVKSSS